MNWTNPLGTITSILTVVSGVMSQVLGCTPGAGDLAATCTASWLGSYSAIAALAFGVITLALKTMRPGGFIHSWFGSTAVVVPIDKAGPGTVTKAQVQSQPPSQ